MSKINYRRATIYAPCQKEPINLDEQVGEILQTVREIVDQIEDAYKWSDIGMLLAYLATIPVLYLIGRYIFIPFLSWFFYSI